ncbi:7459_t:CDS:2 [Dentiscutata erythropus]|uniref:7459_t:CDS:1 n=1 Tax=Dentiscutata erythropus TaxID=1348616 RepID=A0A9N9FJK1_9GLOM|nr:7459_t:CDS:2 [Dentiscutata erythropus]
MRNPKTKFLIKIIFFVTIFICNVIGSFIPEGRAGQEAILIGTQLYFMGGSRTIPSSNPIKSNIRGYNLSDEVFFLDLSSAFSTNNPPFVDLSDAGARMEFGNEKGSVVLGGANKDNVYLVGGTQQDLALLNKDDQNKTITSNQTLMIEQIFNTYNATDQMIFLYRPASRAWSTLGQGVIGTQPTRRRTTSTVIDQNGKIYIFGGRVEFDMFSHTLILYNDLYTFDTTLIKWEKIDAANAPSARSHATPILLPSGKILYIGGVTQSAPGVQTNLLPMTEPRVGHTATLTPNNKTIIILGGTTSYVLNQTVPQPNYLSLDISKEPYQYSELKLSGNNPPYLSFHTTTLYSNYMIVAFGNITNDASPSYETSPNIYLLDVNCLAWANKFSTDSSSCPTPSPSSPSPSGPSIGLIVGLVLVGLFAIVVVAAIIWFIQKKVKKRKKSNILNAYPSNGYPSNGYPSNGYPSNGYPNGYRAESCA